MKKDELDIIEEETDDTDKKLRRMLSSRQKMEEPCTWPILYNALKHSTVDMPKVAAELKKRKFADQAGEYVKADLNMYS